MGTSMGCMHGFVWAEAHPDFARAIMPMACLPGEIAGRNRMWRRAAIEGIRADPAWAEGDYASEPLQGLRTAVIDPPARRSGPALRAGDLPDPRARRRLHRRADRGRYRHPRRQRSHLPARSLAQLRSAAGPRAHPRGHDLGEQRRRFHQSARARPRRSRRPPAAERALPPPPGQPETRGHGTHTWARFWKDELVDLLRRTERR